MRTLNLLLSVAFLASCVPAETGIDRTRVTGQVVVPPVYTDEGADDDDNDRRADAAALEPLHYAITVVQGEFVSFGENENGFPSADADKDWMTLTSELEFDADFELRLPGADNDTRFYIQVFDNNAVWEIPETCGIELDACLDAGTDAATCQGEYDACAEAPENFDRIDERVIRGNKARIQFPFEADGSYTIGLGGLEGTGPQPYNLILKGADPNEAGVLVGAYENPDPTNRGDPLGGTSAQEFRIGENWTWTADFEMLYIRRTDSETCDLKDNDNDGEIDEGETLTCSEYIRDGEACDGLDNDDDGSVDEGLAGELTDVDGEPLGEDEEGLPLCGTLPAQVPDTVVDEGVTTAWIYAGDWNSLNNALPAGTWYSDVPVEITIPDQEVVQTVEVPAPPALTAIAPLVIGWEVDEVEPNDTTADSSVPSLDIENGQFQDLGTLSGPGFVDIIRGAITYEGNPDTWDADVDGFKFQVSEPTTLLFTLDWAEPVDLDILIMDAENEVYGLGYFNQPEVNEYPDEVYQPGQDYYIGIMIWTSGDDAGTSYDWELALEQNAG